MTYKVSALKWRPNSFDEVIGQQHITKALKNAIQFNRISHAFTFSGPRGTRRNPPSGKKVSVPVSSWVVLS